MNHVTSLMWLMLATTALFMPCGMTSRTPSPRLRAVSRWAWRPRSVRSTPWPSRCRPDSGSCCARCRRPARWSELVAPGAGVALPVAALCAVNWATTGAPLRFGYTVMWGRSHDLGFHAAPWGDLHTPARGLELLNLYFLRLQSYLFETPFPRCCPPSRGWASAGAGSTPTASSSSAVRCSACSTRPTGTTGSTSARGSCSRWPGARALVRARHTIPVGIRWPAGAGVALVTGVADRIGMLLPIRVRQYQQGMISLRWNPDAELERAGVKDALVLVRESWGASCWCGSGPWACPGRRRSTTTGRSIPACSSRPSAAWSGGCRLDACAGCAEPLVSDSIRLVRSAESSDPTLRRLPGHTRRCATSAWPRMRRASRSSRPTSFRGAQTCGSCGTFTGVTACCSPAMTAPSTCSSLRVRRRCRAAVLSGAGRFALGGLAPLAVTPPVTGAMA